MDRIPGPAIVLVNELDLPKGKDFSTKIQHFFSINTANTVFTFRTNHGYHESNCEKGGREMANCEEMKKGDVFVCKNCGLELQVVKKCTCGSGSTQSCTVPLQCCGEDMKKK